MLCLISCALNIFPNLLPSLSLRVHFHEITALASAVVRHCLAPLSGLSRFPCISAILSCTAPSKLWCPFIKLHGVTPKKTVILILIRIIVGSFCIHFHTFTACQSPQSFHTWAYRHLSNLATFDVLTVVTTKMWRRVFWSKLTDFSEESAAPTFKASFLQNKTIYRLWRQASLKFARDLIGRHMPEAINCGQWFVVLRYVHVYSYISVHTMTRSLARARSPCPWAITRSNIQYVTTKINNSVWPWFLISLRALYVPFKQLICRQGCAQ